MQVITDSSKTVYKCLRGTLINTVFHKKAQKWSAARIFAAV